jgi:hypothetical protein
MTKLIAAAALLMCTIGSAHAGCYIANYDANDIPNEVCTNNSAPSAPAAPDEYVAIAVSDGGLHVGISHGPETEQMALQRCRKTGTGCVIEDTAVNSCDAIAISILDKKLGYASDPNRTVAGQTALAQCRNLSSSCKLVAAVCAGDD